MTDAPKLDDGDRAMLRECPFRQFVPSGNTTRATAARLKRLRSLVLRGWLHGKPNGDAAVGFSKVSRGYNYEITLTAKGRVALGLPPEPPAP